MPSNWAPSRSVVSKISTLAGRAAAAAATPPVTSSTSSASATSGMFDPVLVAVDLAADGPGELVGDGGGHRARARHLAVVDRADGRDLGRGAAHEQLLGDVEVAAGDVAHQGLEAQVVGDGDDRVLGDALEGA